jgi:hypothetical protein
MEIPATDSPALIRGMGLWSATALNMIDMIGVGPFITMPLVLSAMGGPQALLGWIAWERCWRYAMDWSRRN